MRSNAFTLSAVAAVAAMTANAGSVTSVPIRLHGTDSPVVMVRVQGQDLPLQLDLGDASSIVLHPEVLKSLHSEPTTETFRAFSMDGKIETPIVRLDLVEVGGAKMFGVAARADAHDDAYRNHQKTEIGAVGFVGAGLFKSGQLVVDYSRKRLQISRPQGSGAARNVCRGQPVPLDTNSTWGLTTPVSTDVGELLFVWDTGAPAIVMSRSAATAVHLATDVDSAVFKKFVIGPRNFGPQRVDIWDMPTPAGMAGLIGHPFFQEHVVCVDGPGHRLLVE
jgi:predicted aspartyl protease